MKTKTIRKQNMTKLLLTATMCAVLLFGATACNNANDVNSNLNTDEATDNIGDTPAATDDNVVPTEPVVPDAGAVE